MKTISVLGNGIIGKYIVKKLAKLNYAVNVYDFNVMTSHGRVGNKRYFNADLRKPADLNNALLNADLIVNGLPGALGYNALKAAIKLGKNIVDYSFMEENPLALNKLAIERDVTAVVDFGFAPGMSHMFAGRGCEELTDYSVNKITINVCGLPLDEDEEYKAVFSPRDVLEEYTRPARYLKNGSIVTEEPFKNDYQFLGPHTKLSGFISDGLRTLVSTLHVPNIVEYTLRYSKHFSKMKHLKEDGFFNPENIENTAKVLTDKWALKNTKDFSFLEVKVETDVKSLTYRMYDEYNEKDQDHSMARVTGSPVVAMANEILNERYVEKGVIPPEYVARNEKVFKKVCEYISKEGIKITFNKLEVE